MLGFRPPHIVKETPTALRLGLWCQHVYVLLQLGSKSMNPVETFPLLRAAQPADVFSATQDSLFKPSQHALFICNTVF